MAALSRLMSELVDLQNNQPFVSVDILEGDYYRWIGTLIGPDDTAFEGGIFQFFIKFPKTYPTNPPKFRFLTPIFHPNVFPDNGRVCHSLLTYKWDPNSRPRLIIDYIIELLNNPEPASGFMWEATDVCTRSKEEWFSVAQEWTIREAMGEWK